MKTILFAWLLTGVFCLGQGLTVGTNYVNLAGTTNRITDTGTALTYGNGATLDRSVGTLTLGVSGQGQAIITPTSTGVSVDLNSASGDVFAGLGAFSNFGNLYVAAGAGGGTGFAFNAYTNAIGTGGLSLVGTVDGYAGGNVIDWAPDIGAADGGYNYAHGTTQSRSAGYLFGLKNNNTNKFSVNYLGAAKVGSVTKAQKTAMATPENGMIVYQTDNTAGFRVYIGGTWFILSTAADP